LTKEKIRIAIIGAGGRGLNAHGTYIAEHPDANAQVVAVVDPKPDRRDLARQMFPDLKDEMIFTEWERFVDLGKVADAVIIATLEDIHEPISVACSQLGYHILLEKPMAPTAEQCRAIVREAKSAGIIFAVCHVLRYTPFYRKIKAIVDSGALGEIIHIQHVEDVSYSHFTHSYVRGHYRSSETTSFSLLSKSCHDIDIIRYLLGEKCVRVQSFGSLLHFARANRPPEAGNAAWCTDCAYEPHCPYSAVKIYVRKGVRIGADAMPGESISRPLNTDELWTALREGIMGRCVYECDNDVVDHQVVNLVYEGGQTAAFTMAGFTEGGRKTSVLGTRGVLRGQLSGGSIRWCEFLTDEWHDESLSDDTPTGGHAGGDPGMMREWLDAIRSGDQSKIITGSDETLETHLTTFAAERSRLDGDVKTIQYS